MISPEPTYRSRLYSAYGRALQDEDGSFDFSAAMRWGVAKRWHLRGWLPCEKSKRILDIGCGNGRLLYFLASEGYTRLEGVDRSPDQAATARRVCPNVVEGDVITFLKAHPESFDAILAIDVIEHLDKSDILTFLDAALKALRTGGRLVLQTPNAQSPWGSQMRYGDFTHELAFTPGSLKRLMTFAGFRSVESRECTPPPLGYSVSSSIRAALWQVIRLILSLYNVIEIGTPGDRIFTRVFLISAIRGG